MTEEERLLDGLRELSNILLSEETLSSALKRVARVTVRVLQHCDAAGASVVDGPESIMAGGSDETVEAIEEFQYRVRSGPCYQAIVEGRIFKIDRMNDEPRWPGFAERAAEEGVTSSLSLPLMEDGSSFGALNLYSYNGASLDADERGGVALAAQASGALANMRRYEELRRTATRLTEALDSKVSLATGILIERHGCTREQALATINGLTGVDGMTLEEAATSIVRSVAPDIETP